MASTYSRIDEIPAGCRGTGPLRRGAFQEYWHLVDNSTYILGCVAFCARDRCSEKAGGAARRVNSN